jgi:hypothetical protein
LIIVLISTPYLDPTQHDTHPEKLYPLDPSGMPLAFNDLPLPYRANVNVSEVPTTAAPATCGP